MAVDLKILEQWFRTNGKAINTDTGVWVRGYLKDIASLIEDNIEAGYQKGLKATKQGRKRK